MPIHGVWCKMRNMMSDFARIHIPEKCAEIQTQLRKYTGNSFIQLVTINKEKKGGK